jgi:hypothetical protein
LVMKYQKSIRFALQLTYRSRFGLAQKFGY